MESRLENLYLLKAPASIIQNEYIQNLKKKKQ